jgi:hypothetical protein
MGRHLFGKDLMIMSRLIVRTAHVDRARFYVGSARWRTSLTGIVAPLVPLLDAGVAPWPQLFLHPYGLGTRIWPSWIAWLHEAQNARCFWCHAPMASDAATVEHVLPYSGRLWPRIDGTSQLLSLRLSHQECNQAYAIWRGHQSARKLHRMDDRLLRLVRQQIARHPIFVLYAYRHHSPEPTAWSAAHRDASRLPAGERLS